MAKYQVLQVCFMQGERYDPDENNVMELNDEMVVYNYRAMGYIGAEIPKAKRKGRRVKRNANNAK